MDPLTIFGFAAVLFMLVCYMLEERAPFWTLLFAFACVMSGVYGFLQGAWPFAMVEVIWTFVALQRWRKLKRRAEPRA